MQLIVQCTQTHCQVGFQPTGKTIYVETTSNTRLLDCRLRSPQFYESYFVQKEKVLRNKIVNKGKFYGIKASVL